MAPITKCVACANGTEFVDLPEGSAAERWHGVEDRPMCKCTSCGAWYPQESVDESARKER